MGPLENGYEIENILIRSSIGGPDLNSLSRYVFKTSTQQFTTSTKTLERIGKMVVKKDYEMSFDFVIADFELTPTGLVTTKPFLTLGRP